MRTLFTSFLLIFTGISFSAGMDTTKAVIAGTIGGGTFAETWFRVKDDAAAKVVNALFTIYPEAKRKNYMHHFHNVSVRGIDGVLDLRVNEGVYSDFATETCNHAYFHTFTSAKYHDERISRMTENEGFGVTIFVKKKKGKQKFICTDEEKKAFVSFLYTLIDYKAHD